MRLQKWIYTVPLRLRSLFRKAEVESELSAELEDHLDRKARELIATGSAPNEARRTAMREFGGLEQSKERCRDARRVNFLEDVIQVVPVRVRFWPERGDGLLRHFRCYRYSPVARPHVYRRGRQSG